MRRRLSWMGQRAPGDLAFALLAVMVTVSVLVSPLPSRSLAALPPLLAGLILYCLLTRWPFTIVHLHWAWWGMILTGLAICLLAPPATFPPNHVLFRWFPLWARLRPYLPDTFNENVVSGALAVLLPFGVARGVQSWRAGCRWGPQVLLAVIAAIPLGILAMSTSRGGYLATAAALLILLGLLWPQLSRWVIPGVMIVALVAGTYIGWGVIADALMTGQATSGLDGRVEIWSRALMIIADFPFTGAGLGCFEPIVATLYPLFLAPQGTVAHAHNLFLQVAVDVGLPGLVAYLALLGLSFYAGGVAYRAFRSQGRRELALLSAACLGSLGGMCVQGLIDAVAWGNKGAFIPWVVLGLSVALYRFSQEEAKANPC